MQTQFIFQYSNDMVFIKYTKYIFVECERKNKTLLL